MPDFEEIVLGKGEKGRKTAVVASLVVFAIYFTFYQGPGAEIADTSVIAVAMDIADGPNSHPDFSSVHESADSWSSRDWAQHISGGLGTGVLVAPFYSLFRFLGFRIFFAMIPALTAMAFFSFLYRRTQRRWLATLGALALTINPLSLSYGGILPVYSLLLVSSAIFLMLETRPLRPTLVGVLSGLMVGIHWIGAIYVPLLAVWVMTRSTRKLSQGSSKRKIQAVKAGALFLVGFAITAIPIVYGVQSHTASYLFPATEAGILHAPSQFAFGYHFLGFSFTFDGLLNAPIHDQFVRTPHFPFPLFLMAPLMLTRVFGLLAIAVAILGIGPAFRQHARSAGFLLAWLLVTCLFFAFLEDWDEWKMSFLLLMMPSVAYFLVTGAGHMTSVAVLKSSVLRVAGISLLLAIAIKFCFYLEFPEDSRWYQKHPEAIAAPSQDGLKLTQRLTPKFYTARETAEERLENKERFTEISLWPTAYLPPDPKLSSLGTRLVREIQARSFPK